MELYIKAGIYAIVLIAIIVLCILARNEELPESIENTGISGAVYKVASFIYTRYIRRKRALEVSKIKNETTKDITFFIAFLPCSNKDKKLSQ